MMNIRPLYDRIVVKRIEEQETTRNGIVIPDSGKEKPQEGEVMAIGKGKRLDDGKVVALDVKAGDRILFGKYSGSDTKVDGTEYLVMREDDVLGVLDGAAQAVKKTVDRRYGTGGLVHVESTTPRLVSNAGDDDLVLFIVGGNGGYVERDGHLVNAEDAEKRQRMSRGEMT